MVNSIGSFSQDKAAIDEFSEKMIPPISEKVILGVTHLFVDGQLVRLLKCPFCNFKNIHEDTITRHIRHTDDSKHWVDLDKLDKNMYFVTSRKKSHYGHYASKQDLPLPWIRCLWCSYRDKVERDLSFHFLECHRHKLYKIKIGNVEWRMIKQKDPFYFLYERVEFVLDKAVRVAKLRDGISSKCRG
jgi:hypothetical protein